MIRVINHPSVFGTVLGFVLRVSYPVNFLSLRPIGTVGHPNLGKPTWLVILHVKHLESKKWPGLSCMLGKLCTWQLLSNETTDQN